MTALSRVDTLTSPPVVGQAYLVPCVHLPLSDVPLPVIGPAHADPELGARRPHYHYDVRFFTRRQMRELGKTGDFYGKRYIRLRTLMLTVIDSDDRDLRYQALTCMRLQPEQRELSVVIEVDTHTVVPVAKLGDYHHGARLKRGHICPHRGADLRSVPVKDGCKTCPLHGLKFDAATGALVDREGRA